MAPLKGVRIPGLPQTLLILTSWHCCAEVRLLPERDFEIICPRADPGGGVGPRGSRLHSGRAVAACAGVEHGRIALPRHDGIGLSSIDRMQRSIPEAPAPRRGGLSAGRARLRRAMDRRGGLLRVSGVSRDSLKRKWAGFTSLVA